MYLVTYVHVVVSSMSIGLYMQLSSYLLEVISMIGKINSGGLGNPSGEIPYSLVPIKYQPSW
jgi:hypothetical protein